MSSLDEQPADQRRLTELGAQADHASRRYSLYKARVHGPRATSPGRLGALKRDAERAQERLNRAQTNA